MSAVLALLALLAVVVAAPRWLRVAQREHYAPGRVSRFALRWWLASPVNRGLGLVGVAAAVVAALPLGLAPVAMVGLGVAVVGPVGLGLRGRTAPLAWTRRLRVVAGLVGLVSAAVGTAAWLVTPGLVAAVALALPVLVDAGLALDAPLERRLSARYVRDADARLRRVAPTVVGITGSYGKTTVKHYALHLLGRSRKTLASRKSFNNRLGLATSVNQDLEPGTEYYLAEMGTYGVGEIAALCDWFQPTISVITAIGPVHLERMGSLDTIVTAKREILTTARTAVLNVDVDRLRPVADAEAAAGRRVVRCAEHDDTADVQVRRDGDHLDVRIADERWRVPAPPGGLVPVNVALALGICVAADAVPAQLEAAVASLPSVANRLVVTTADDGPTLIDDTYNANPAGAAVALARLRELATEGGRQIVVTPGMVELGSRQHEDNLALGRAVATQGAALVVVGRTNRRALVAGCAAAGGEAVLVADRDGAVAWVRANTGPGDVVLFENDLPDHFP